MRQKLIFSISTMFISPALTLFIGLRSNNQDYNRWLLIVFITFYGSLITLSEGTDGYTHWNNVNVHYVGLDFAEFTDELIHIISFNPKPTTNDDVYIHVLSYFTGSVLALPQLFFVFVAFIYAYFFSSVIFKILNHAPRAKYDWLFYGFVIVFLLWKNIEGINTVRTWTGLWVLAYGAISYFETRNNKYLFLMAIPPLIHVGYFAMIIPAWIVVIFGARPKIYVAIFLLSFVITINQKPVISNLEQTQLGKGKVEAYYQDDEQVAESLRKFDSSTWYKTLYANGLQNWGINTIAIVLILFGFYFKDMNILEAKLFSIGLLTKALANLSYFLFALGHRSNIVAGLFILMTLILMWKRGYFYAKVIRSPFLLRSSMNITFLLFTPFLIFRVADIIYFLSAYIIALPFIPWVAPELNISIREVVGNLLN